VPSLKAITDSDDMPQKNFETLNSEVTIDGPPAPNNRISSWIQLPGGTFTADYNKWTGKFDPDHQAKGERLFGEWITLTTVIQTPTLQVSKEKDKWIDIPLDAGGVVLTVENNPPPNKPGDLQTHHFHMHYDLAGVPINDAPHRPRIRKLRNRLTVADAGLMNFINDVIDRSPGSDASQREKKLVDVLVTDVPGCSNSTWP
jgi:hypothetical protein